MDPYEAGEKRVEGGELSSHFVNVLGLLVLILAVSGGVFVSRIMVGASEHAESQEQLLHAMMANESALSIQEQLKGIETYDGDTTKTLARLWLDDDLSKALEYSGVNATPYVGDDLVMTGPELFKLLGAIVDKTQPVVDAAIERRNTEAIFKLRARLFNGSPGAGVDAGKGAGAGAVAGAVFGANGIATAGTNGI